MKLVHAYLKHAENKRFSKKQFPCLFPYIYIFCSRFHSGLCYSMIPCLFLPPLCFLVWLKAPVYLPQWLLCLLLQPCFTVTCIFTQITGSCCSILLNNKCCHKKQYHTFANFKQFHRLPLYICMSLSFYTEISFKWRLKTGTCVLNPASAGHGTTCQVTKRIKRDTICWSTTRLLCVKEQPDCSF